MGVSSGLFPVDIDFSGLIKVNDKECDVYLQSFEPDLVFVKRIELDSDGNVVAERGEVHQEAYRLVVMVVPKLTSTKVKPRGKSL